MLSEIERFNRHVRKSDCSDCILWTAALSRDGYGNFWIGSKSSGNHRCVLTHRFIWEYTYGEIPSKLEVLHKCDNPSCVNVEHLFLGTHTDNMKDMSSKWRGTKSKSGLPFGVYVQSSGRFGSQVKTMNGKVYPGTFDTAEEASAAAIDIKLKHLKKYVSSK